MKQILQNLSNGQTLLADVPRPLLNHGHVLIQTRRSLISAGTERMLLDFGKAGWVDKARQQPDKVKMVLDKARTDGVLSTVDAVRSKLDQPLPLGYCNAGVVVEVGNGVTGFAIGDRVVSNGNHAEFVVVPKNLVAKIPETVSDDQAAFVVLGAIGLQGIRLCQPTLGETFVVMGLGLIGLMTVQMLRAHGCKVIGLDFDSQRLALAEALGAQVVDLSSTSDPVQETIARNGGREVDAVLVAAATKKNDPITHAAKMCRKRGRIVLVGVTGLELNRTDFFQKELTFQVSCSYGPGRYDPDYELAGNDYPIGYVRWTEQRNFEAVLGLFADNALKVDELISHRFAIASAQDAYEALGGEADALGILLEYSESPSIAQTLSLAPARSVGAGQARVSVIGAGNYATRNLIPAFAKANAQFKTLVSAGGVSATHHGKKHLFEAASTDTEAALRQADVDAVIIATRHDQHAAQVLSALRAGKHVFCEKPLALTLDEVTSIAAEAESRPEQLLMMGFNRRFAPTTVKLREALRARSGAKAFVATINAGAIPEDHWTQDKSKGGGRIIGEACHFIDLLRFLCGHPIVSSQCHRVGEAKQTPSDNATITLSFQDGSIGTIHYLSEGHKSYPKERIEVFSGGAVFQIDNFKELKTWGAQSKRVSPLDRLRQDKGQERCAAAFLKAITEGLVPPIPIAEIFEVSRVSIEVATCLEQSELSN